jgi:hypothetical protein
MRKALVNRLAFGLTVFSAIGLWMACGGSDPQDVVSADAGEDSRNNRPDVPEEEPFDAGPPKDAARDVITIPARDAGKPIIIFPDGGPYAEAGIACYEGGELELEPNEDKATANPLRPIRCGVVEIPDGGAADADVEWLTFNVRDASTGFFLQYEGNVKVFVETDGMAPVDITLADASIPVFTKDQPYFVQVQTNSGKTQFWKIILFEEPK